MTENSIMPVAMLKDIFDKVIANPGLLTNQQFRQSIINLTSSVFEQQNELNKNNNSSPEQNQLKDLIQRLPIELTEKNENLPMFLNAILKLVEFIFKAMGYDLQKKPTHAGADFLHHGTGGGLNYNDLDIRSTPAVDTRSPQEIATGQQRQTEKREEESRWEQWIKAGNDPEYNRALERYQAEDFDSWSSDQRHEGDMDISRKKFQAYNQGKEDAAMAIKNDTAADGPDVTNAKSYVARSQSSEGFVERLNSNVQTGYAQGFNDGIKEYRANHSRENISTTDFKSEVHASAAPNPILKMSKGLDTKQLNIMAMPSKSTIELKSPKNNPDNDVNSSLERPKNL